MTATLGARLVVAGTHSGVGKTTVATGLMAALRARGQRPACAKVGPDFIDPSYHALASGRPPRNLDPWICGPEAIAPLAARAASGADLLVIEGVMGLFDGAGDGTTSSTAEVAKALDAPVVLVVDVGAMSSSVAALVHGYASFDRQLRIAGVVLNRVGSAYHEALLREALAGMPTPVPVLGALRRDDALVWRDRHLGLVPVAEDPASIEPSLIRLATLVTDSLDLEGIVRLARSAPRRSAAPVVLPASSGTSRVAVAAGRAFSFTYTDTLEALAAAGSEVVTFDPLVERSLPEAIDGLVLGGGFPEVHAARLSENRPLLDDLAARVAAGLPTWAECGGLLLLCESLDGHPMARVIHARATMTESLTIGYREATLTLASPLGNAGTTLRGHEFHYSATHPGGDALVMSSRAGRRRGGWATAGMIASYLHHHPGGDPSRVAQFSRSCAAWHRQCQRL